MNNKVVVKKKHLNSHYLANFFLSPLSIDDNELLNQG